MKEFIEYILQFGNLNPQQIELISKKVTELELNKDDFYWKQEKQLGRLALFQKGFSGFIITTTKEKNIHDTLLMKTI